MQRSYLCIFVHMLERKGKLFVSLLSNCAELALLRPLRWEICDRDPLISEPTRFVDAAAS